MSEGFSSGPALDIWQTGQTGAGVGYAISEDAPEEMLALLEELQVPIRLGREVDWVGQTSGVLDVDVRVLWDEEDQRVTYSVPGAQSRSVAVSDLAGDLGRDWERYLEASALANELLGRLDAVTSSAGIDAEEVSVRFDPEARAVTADVELVPVSTGDGLSTRGMSGRIGVKQDGFDLDLEGDVPARQLDKADARLVLSDAVMRASREPSQVAWEEIRPYVAPFQERGLEVEDPVVSPDGAVSVQVLASAVDVVGGSIWAEQAVTFSLKRSQDVWTSDDGLVISPGGSLTRQLREGRLDTSDGAIWGLSPDLAIDPDVREMSDARAAATILGMSPEAFDSAAQGIENGLSNAELELRRPLRSTAVFHALNEEVERLSRTILHGVPADAVSTSLDLERGIVWTRPQAMNSSHRPITVGSSVYGQTFEVVDRKEVPNGQVGPWADPEPLSDEQRAIGARPVSEGEATWDVDSAVLRDGEQSVAADWASMRVSSSDGWWEPQEAAALERWARAQAALTGGDARVTVYETRAGGPDNASGRLIDMRGNGMDCRVTTTSPGQVTVTTPADKSTMTTTEMMDQIRATWPDTTTGVLSTATSVPTTERGQDASQVQAEAPELTVYTTPNCPGCKMTKRELDKAGAAYQEVDLSGRPDLVEQFRAEGLRSAPVVELGNERIAGFNPAKIRAIAAQAMSPTPPTAPAPAGASRSPETRPSENQQSRVRGETR